MVGEKLVLNKLDKPSESPLRVVEGERVQSTRFKGASFKVGDTVKISYEIAGKSDTYENAEVKEIIKFRRANGSKGTNLIIFDTYWGRGNDLVFGEHVTSIKKLPT